MTKKVGIYVDGFNFYYSLKKSKANNTKWRKFYWIDIVKLFQQYLNPEYHELIFVKYFTAKHNNSTGKVKRQSIWLSSQKALHPNIFQVIYGNYKDKQLTCPLECSYSGAHKRYKTAEEKETDVNVAINIVSDVYENNVDMIILVSGDSDMSPPLRLVRDKFPDKKIKIYFPPKQGHHYSSELSRIINSKDKTLLEQQPKLFEQSIMDDKFEINGKKFFIPPKWKRYQ